MAIVVGVLCVFSVLVLLFRDFLQPVTILSAIPLSLGGALVALLVARSELDVPAMIGLVMLMGIGIIGALASILASYLVGGAEEEEETQTAAALRDFTAELAALRAEVEVLRASLEALPGATGSPRANRQSGAAPE